MGDARHVAESRIGARPARNHRGRGEAGGSDSWTAGVRLTADRVRERLSRYGVVTLDPKGLPFDPHFHEALLEIDAPEGVSPGAVVQVAHLGYARGDRALRPARVVVARSPAAGKA